MKLQRAHLLVVALCMALIPVHAAEIGKKLRPRDKAGQGSVRMQVMGKAPAAAVEPGVTTRGGNLTIWVAPPPTGDNATGDGSQGAPYATIQFAFLTAVSGDTIRVLPGTYNECVNNTAFALGVQKNLTVVADDFLVNGNRATTVIDGTGQCVFPFSVVNLAGSASGSRFEGFTVRGGVASGVFVLGSGTVTNNVISNNSSLEGGGVYAYPGTCFYGTTGILVSDNQIVNNTADDEGRCDVSFTLCNDDSNCPAAETCLFRGGDGGGLFVRADAVNSGGTGGCVGGDGRITLDNNIIDGNGADAAFGGGVYVLTNSQSGRLSAVTITQNLISNNSTLPFSFGYGGGIWMGTFGYGTETIDFVSNTVTSNVSTGDGGGVSAWIDALGDGNHTINLSANDVQMNTAEGSGGGMDLFVFGLDLQDSNDSIQLNAGSNLILNNQAQGIGPSFYPGVGGGISSNVWSQRSNAPTLELNIFENDIRGNTAAVGGGGIATLSIADSDPADNAMDRGPALARANVRNNLVGFNNATDGVFATTAVGGGIYAYAEGLGGLDASTPAVSRIELSFNTVALNDADTGGGGIEIESYTELDTNGDGGTAEIEVDHSIIFDNTGIGVGGVQPPGSGVLLTAGLAPIRDPQGMLQANTGALTVTTERNSLFMNPGGGYEAWFPPGTNDLNSDPLLDLAFIPDQCSDTIDAANPLESSAAEPPPNGPYNPITMEWEPIANLGHTGGTAAAVNSLSDSSGDGYVDGIDILRLSVAFAADVFNSRWDPTVDLDGDNFISGIDLALMAAQFAVSCP